MAAVAPDTDEWQPPPHEPEIGDIESYQAFARALNAPPKKLIPIGERDRRWYNKKSHILLEADPEALVTPEKLAQRVFVAECEGGKKKSDATTSKLAFLKLNKLKGYLDDIFLG